VLGFLSQVALGAALLAPSQGLAKSREKGAASSSRGTATADAQAKKSRSKGAPASKLHYLRIGKGPAVVFLHGMGGDLASWIDEAQRLEKTHTVVLIDLPGHGASAVPPQGIDLVDIGREVALILANEKLAPATLVGHSLGAVIAGYAALADKTVARSVVMVDSLVDPYPISREARAKLRTALDRGQAQALRDFFGAGTRDAGQLDKIVAAATRVKPKVFMGYLDFACERSDLADRLGEIKVPVHAIVSPVMTQGKSDPTQVQAILGQAGFSGLSDFSFDYIEGSRHWPHWDQPDVFHAMLSKHLARVEGTPSGRPVAKIPSGSRN
jgi:pimeloyl-ACP methyl ester carboxylesterase